MPGLGQAPLWEGGGAPSVVHLLYSSLLAAIREAGVARLSRPAFTAILRDKQGEALLSEPPVSLRIFEWIVNLVLAVRMLALRVEPSAGRTSRRLHAVRAHDPRVTVTARTSPQKGLHRIASAGRFKKRGHLLVPAQTSVPPASTHARKLRTSAQQSSTMEVATVARPTALSMVSGIPTYRLCGPTMARHRHTHTVATFDLGRAIRAHTGRYGWPFHGANEDGLSLILDVDKGEDGWLVHRCCDYRTMKIFALPR